MTVPPNNDIQAKSDIPATELKKKAIKYGALKTALPWIVGVCLIGFMALLPLLNISLPLVLPTATYLPGSLALLSLCMIFAALALSYNLVLGTAGMLSFGHALYFGGGAYILGIILAQFNLPLIMGMGISVVGGLLIAFVTGFISLRVSGIPFAMVTLAFAQAGSVFVSRNSDFTGGEEGLALETQNVPDILVGVANTRNLYWLMLGILVFVYVIVMWVDHSNLGHLARAARENEERVRTLGFSPYLARIYVFVIAAVLAGLAGMGYLLLQSGTVPRTVSSDLTLTILVIVVLGGIGFRWGAVLGGFIYTILDQRLAVLANSEAISSLPAILRIPLSQPLFLLGILFIVVVMFLPGGIAGTVERLRKHSSRQQQDTRFEAMDQ